tara:strand:- start:1383 stop:1541 length:159 start_codon:yes stop_codon:yes gene_type:complete
MREKKVKTEKGLVKKLREIRDRMNSDMENMDLGELKAYLREMKEKPSTSSAA